MQKRQLPSSEPIPIPQRQQKMADDLPAREVSPVPFWGTPQAGQNSLIHICVNPFPVVHITESHLSINHN